METKGITTLFGDKALGSWSAASIQATLESIESTFKSCNEKLAAVELPDLAYVFQADAISEMTDNMLKLQSYASTAHGQVSEELDFPLYLDFKDNATESLSQIILEDLSTENTFGMEEHYAVSGKGTVYGQKRVKTELTMKDFLGLEDVEAEEGMPSLENVEIIGQFAGLFRQDFLSKASYMDLDKRVEQYLTYGEFDHEAYHPVEDFLSGLLDLTIVKPIYECCTGTDIITKERLSESEKTWKATGAMIDLFTFGQGSLAIHFAGYTGKEALEAIGRTMLVDLVSNSTVYTVSYGADMMGLPPEVNWLLSVATGCTVSVAGADFILHGMDGSVRKISAEELEDVLKNKNNSNDALNSILKNQEVPPVNNGGGVASANWADWMSPEDAARYNRWVELREVGLDQQVVNDILLTNKGYRPDPTTYLSQEYISAHLSLFDEGASIIMTQEQYITYVKGASYIGIPTDGTQFVLPKSYCDQIAQNANGNINYFEDMLGFDTGHFQDGGGLVRIDINNLEGLNLRMPSGNEVGANSHWIPGGITDGGVPEAITDLIPNNPENVTITHVE